MSANGCWRIAAASVAGSAHRNRGDGCQDAFAYAEFVTRERTPVVAVVAADGAGSATQAERGARLTCDGLLEWLRPRIAGPDSFELLTDALVPELLCAHRARVAEVADRESLEPRDFASTLVCAVLAPDRAFFVQVGDGAIVARRGTGFELVFWPDEGEYAGVTTFATDENAIGRAQAVCWREQVQQVALVTDGLQRLVLDYATRSAHDPFFAKMFGALADAPHVLSQRVSEMLADYLSSPELDRRTDDDRTLVLVHRHDDRPR